MCTLQARTQTCSEAVLCSHQAMGQLLSPPQKGKPRTWWLVRPCTRIGEKRSMYLINCLPEAYVTDPTANSASSWTVALRQANT